MSPWRLTPSVRLSCCQTRSTPSLKPSNQPHLRESVYVLARPERFRVGHCYFFFFLAAFLAFFLRVFFTAVFFVDFFAAFLRLVLAIRSPPFLNKIVHHEFTLSKKFFSQSRCAKYSAQVRRGSLTAARYANTSAATFCAARLRARAHAVAGST